MRTLFLSQLGPVGIVFIVVAIILLLVFISCIRIVPQANAVVVERLGAYRKTWGTGIHLLAPFIDRVAKKMSLKEQVVDFDPQPVITKDNVTMQIDTVVFFQITDPKAYAYGVERPSEALEKLTATTLRNIIGEIELDATLTSRDLINSKMRTILDEATDPWGIKVNRVEVKNILPPKDIREAMEKQMRAEREKREKILLAEGQKQSAILVAEGQKASAILNAEAEKQMAILRAEGEAESLRKVKEAEADGIRAVREAEAEGLKMLNASKPTDSVVTLRYYESLTKIADGKATKIFLPSNLEKAASLASVVKEVIKD